MHANGFLSGREGKPSITVPKAELIRVPQQGGPQLVTAPRLVSLLKGKHRETQSRREVGIPQRHMGLLLPLLSVPEPA